MSADFATGGLVDPESTYLIGESGCSLPVVYRDGNHVFTVHPDAKVTIKVEPGDDELSALIARLIAKTEKP